MLGKWRLAAPIPNVACFGKPPGIRRLRPANSGTQCQQSGMGRSTPSRQEPTPKLQSMRAPTSFASCQSSILLLSYREVKGADDARLMAWRGSVDGTGG